MNQRIIRHAAVNIGGYLEGVRSLIPIEKSQDMKAIKEFEKVGNKSIGQHKTD